MAYLPHPFVARAAFPLCAAPDAAHAQKYRELAEQDAKEKGELGAAAAKLDRAVYDELAAEGEAQCAERAAAAAQAHAESVKLAGDGWEKCAADADADAAAAQEKAAGKGDGQLDEAVKEFDALREKNAATRAERRTHDLSPERVRFEAAPCAAPFAPAYFGPCPTPGVYAVPNAEHAAKARELAEQDGKELRALDEAAGKVSALRLREWDADAAARAAGAATARAQALRDAQQAASEEAGKRVQETAEAASAAKERAEAAKAAAKAGRDEFDALLKKNQETEAELAKHLGVPRVCAPGAGYLPPYATVA